MEDKIDVVIVGSGLAGLVVALSLLDESSLRVAVLEKEAKAGFGNSIKASSGINCVANQEDLPLFIKDTVASAGNSAQPELIEPLVRQSGDALTWLRERLDADLSTKTQLGGHQAERTHRPSGKLPVGAEIMGKLRKAVEAAPHRVQIRTNAKAQRLQVDASSGAVTGVHFLDTETNQNRTVSASHVVLATGGYAANRDLLKELRPDLANFPATLGPFSTGDGLRLGQEIDAACTGLDKIQVHPTGFVDPEDPDNPNKFLCAEVLRGVGGILLNSKGQRFCNELGRRDYITEQVLSLNPAHTPNEKWDPSLKIPTAYLVLSVAAAASASKHVDFYAWKGFLRKVQGSQGLATEIGCSQESIDKTFEAYEEAARVGKDLFGKTRFVSTFDTNEEFYVGIITPVLHYCMGGLSIDTQGHVLGNKDRKPIHGLYAVGEVAGGVHGDNRLAGNSLLECVVFGRAVSQYISAQRQEADSNNDEGQQDKRPLTLAELIISDPTEETQEDLNTPQILLPLTIPSHDSLPAASVKSYNINGIATDMFVQVFSDRIVLGVSQLDGKFGNYMMCQAVPDEVNPKHVEYEVTSLLGAREDTMLSVYARQVTEHIEKLHANPTELTIILAISLDKKIAARPELFQSIVYLLVKLYRQAASV